MRTPGNLWLRRSGRVGLLVALVIAGGVASPLAIRPWWKSHRKLESIPHRAVRRADMNVSLLASGRVQSAQRTVIACELESLQFRSQGNAVNAGGSEIILSVVPEGTIVKRGDVLCRLDSSDYEEIVRDQRIKVEEARASRLQSELDLNVAKMAIREYQEGNRRQVAQDYRGRIALAQADLQRATDRTVWAERLMSKGYLSLAQVAAEKSVLERAAFNLSELEAAFKEFQRFDEPMTLRVLECDVEAAKNNLAYQTLRVKRHEERLAHFEHQVELCTIRAPHDGFVIYANDTKMEIRIEEGAQVWQKQNLFYLPDLSQMEVETMLNETIIDQVRDGMPARVRIEALPGLILEGHVVSVALLPLVNHNTFGGDVKSYLGMVKLDSIPKGLRPGMTAEVEIVTGHRDDALVIPPEAVTSEAGQDVCYVASEEGIERRQVTLGPTTDNMLEVTDGLAEGEEVVLDPARTLVAQSSDPDETFEPSASIHKSPTEIPTLH